MLFSADNVVIAAYYPSPYGSYMDLRANQMTLGSGYRASAFPSNGLIVQGNVSIGYGADTGHRLYVVGNMVATGNIYVGAKGLWLDYADYFVAS